MSLRLSARQTPKPSVAVVCSRLSLMRVWDFTVALAGLLLVTLLGLSQYVPFRPWDAQVEMRLTMF